MAEATIPVDLRNPGQVFACLGLMEAAEVLGCTAVEGGFDFEDEDGPSAFRLQAKGPNDPIDAVFTFLTRAQVRILRPFGVDSFEWPAGAVSTLEMPASLATFRKSDGKGFTPNALPFMLSDGDHELPVSSWLDNDGRNALKLFAGNQVAFKITRDLLNSGSDTLDARDVISRTESDKFGAVFDQTGTLAGSFGFDARGAWEALGIGTSLDQNDINCSVSPLVELLSLIGVQNGRPNFIDNYSISYSTWKPQLPLSLARLVFSTPNSFLTPDLYRTFRASLGADKYYKKCFSATLFGDEQ